jgi:hypothetical protein
MKNLCATLISQGNSPSYPPHQISLVLIEAEQELVKAYMVKEFMKYKDERK